MATPTSNPVPSVDPNDLLYNAEKLDQIVNSSALTYVDRMGVNRRTVAGAIAGLGNSNDRGAWATATAYAVGDIVSNSGTWYVCSEAHTSGATFAGDAAKWAVYQGVTATQLASTASASDGPGMIGHSYAVNYAVGTLGGVVATMGIDITQEPYNADPASGNDIGPIIEQVWADFPGIPIRAPAGTYRWSTSAQLHVASFTGVFGAGPKIYGDGIGKTFFDNRVASGAMIDIDADTGDAHATFKAALGVELANFSVITTTSPASSTAIKLRTSYMPKLRQLHIKGMSAHGIEIVCTVGDNDGSNMISLDQIRLEDCAGWGIKSDCASGYNETSYIHMRHVFFQNCGTTSASATPPSGGMIWKGQIITTEQCAFVLCQNVGLFIPGQAGLANTASLNNTSFENNYKRGLYCTGISGFKGRNLQVYNNDGATATNGIEFDGSSYVVRNIEIDGVVVRATSGNNPHTAFKLSGASADKRTCRVRNVIWDNFDYTGQTRFDGWQFDHIAQSCGLVDSGSSASLLFKASSLGGGNKTPLRLTGGAGGVPSTTGEWVEYEVASGGLVLSTSGLSTSTTYNVYLGESGGTVSLSASTTATAIDTSTGYEVKSGDATKLFVGRARTDGSGNFIAASAAGWLNPLRIPTSQLGVFGSLWVSSGGDLYLKTNSVLPSSDTDGTIK